MDLIRARGTELLEFVGRVPLPEATRQVVPAGLRAGRHGLPGAGAGIEEYLDAPLRAARELGKVAKQWLGVLTQRPADAVLVAVDRAQPQRHDRGGAHRLLQHGLVRPGGPLEPANVFQMLAQALLAVVSVWDPAHERGKGPLDDGFDALRGVYPT